MNYKPGTFEYIEAKIRSDAKGTEFGLDFEKVCKHYLETSPLFKNNLKKVWLWKEWPDRWKQPEHGIDLVAITHDGDYWAIQAKCFDPIYRVKYDDIDSFLTESSRKLFSYRLLIATTNKIGANARDAIEGKGKYAQAIPVGTHLRNELVKAEVTWPTDINKKPTPLKPFDPKPHQKKAIDSVITKFKKADKGQLIMACGTGKTFTSIKIAERLKAKRILVLVPSLNLVNQSIKEWNHNYKTPFKMCVVCSDETVIKGKDAATLSTASLSLPPTTNARKIKAFLKQNIKKPQIVFCTYQSSNKIAEAQKKDFTKFDLVLADEAHRCAGLSGEIYGLVIDDRKIKSKKKLFMTATPRIIGDRVKKQAEDVGEEIFSMCDKEKFGGVFHELKFRDAIKDKILTNYQVAVVGVMGDKNKKFVTEGQIVKVEKNVQTDARTLASQIGLAKAIKKYDLQKIITFHSSVAKAKKFGVSSSVDNNNLEAFSDLIPKLPKKVVPTKNIWTQAISGEMPVDRRIDYLNILEKPDRNTVCLIANCRCLSEGVDVPALDGVGFMDPKSSQTDIIQAVGRAIRKSDTKTIGTIFIPVFIDEADDVNTILSSSAFKPVWSVIRALRSHDDDLANKLDNIRISLGQNKKISLPTKIKFDLPTKLSIKSFQKAFYIKTIESTTTNWDAMFMLLKEYKKKYGHFNPPKKIEKRWEGLFEWVHLIRLHKMRNNLSVERIAELEKLNFKWEIAGVTLSTTKGLIVEKEFIKQSGLNTIVRLRRKGTIKSFGTAVHQGGIAYYYKPSQLEEIRKDLGVTLKSTKGLITENQFSIKSGLSPRAIKKYREEGLIKSVGRSITSGGLTHFYKAFQIEELRKKLGITLKSTKGLITENQFIKKTGYTKIKTYREKGLIESVGATLTSGGLTHFYKPSQIKELKKKLGITLKNTKGLLSEDEFKKTSGLSRLSEYRKKGLIKPIGTYMQRGGGQGLGYFYKPSQIKELKKKLGITLKNTKGLISENELRKKLGFTNISKYRENGLIKPAGATLGSPLINYYYKPSQIEELKKKLGITLKSTKGLIGENELRRRPGFNCITKYRKQGLIKPDGTAFSASKVSFFYKPSQIQEFLKDRGITLKSTKGLLSEKEFSSKIKISVRNIKKYRDKNLIRPQGYGVSSSNRGVSAYYHPRQVAELKKKLKNK